MPNHYVGELLHAMAISGLSCVRTELLHFFVNSTLAATSSTNEWRASALGDLGDLPALVDRGSMSEQCSDANIMSLYNIYSNRAARSHFPADRFPGLGQRTSIEKRRLA